MDLDKISAGTKLLADYTACQDILNALKPHELIRNKSRLNGIEIPDAVIEDFIAILEFHLGRLKAEIGEL